MQIHELNKFSGAPGSADYLAIDNGSETKKISADKLGGLLELDTTAAAGTTDGDLYRAIQALGWESEGIV